jgi:ribonuclease Z
MPTPRAPQHFFPGEPLADGALRVVLLGTGTPFPRRGQACASILVQAGGDYLLLDVGPGAPANLTSLEIPFARLDKVFLTHHHVDHIGGLDHLWLGGWTYGRHTALRIWGPPGTEKIARHLREIYAWDIETRGHAFSKAGAELAVTDYKPGVIYEANGVKVTAFPVIHIAPHNTFGFRIDYRGRSFVFSGDTKRCEALIDMSRGVDLLVHEAFPPAEVYAAKAGRPIDLARQIAEVFHTSPREAGRVFADAGPRLAVLYHLYNNDDLIAPVLDQIRESYGGRVAVGHDLMVVDIGEEVTVRTAIVGDKPWPAPAD